ncbi:MULTISPECIES: hypothetical protein [unclassified Mesorhizobium]|jgi:hypothetical protein|uniref:hypothetical protein n=1 Tax=unclassified Mesorhizobium TaxID=325217 RepID=UPI0013E2A3D5|nr:MULTISPECIES: hypothetical protein [unclassified Mesorhizobium]
MTVTLYQIFGQNIASNPNARSHSRTPLISKKFGNRAARRKLMALARKEGFRA